MVSEQSKRTGFVPAINPEDSELQMNALEKASAKLQSGEIGHLTRENIEEDISKERLITLDGQIPNGITLGLRSIDWDNGTAVCWGGQQYGEITVSIDQLRRLDPVFEAISKSTQS